MYFEQCSGCILYTSIQGVKLKRMYKNIQGCILHPKDVYFGGLGKTILPDSRPTCGWARPPFYYRSDGMFVPESLNIDASTL